MKILKLILPALFVVAVSACSPTSNSTSEKKATDSTVVQKDTSLTARMTFAPNSTAMTFTVYNQTDSTRTFCKWHTPFERLMSSYLDITKADGTQLDYRGAMAKRMMPPPADSYQTVKPGDSLVVKVELADAYTFTGAGNYNVHYNAENISGLKVADAKLATAQ